MLEENNYYSFGLKHQNYNATKSKLSLKASNNQKQVTPTNVNGYKYKYQFQERQNEFDLNWDSFKWRNYDYTIGRFMSIDPLADDYTYNSTYAFQENKMGIGIELEGLEVGIINPNMSFKDNVKLNYYTTKSLGTSLGNTANKLVENGTNPVTLFNSVKNLFKAISNPKKTANAITDSLSQTATDLQSSDPEVAGTAFGKVKAFTVEVVVGAELGSLTKTSKFSKVKEGSSGGPGAGKPFSEAVKDLAEQQANGECVFCGVKTTRSKKPSSTRRNTDHSISKKNGGNNTIGNAQNTCQTCNLGKGSKNSVEYIQSIQN